MFRFSSLTASILLFALLPGCKKESDTPVTTGPKPQKPKLIINGPTAVSVQKYRDTLLIPFEFRSSDSTQQIDVHNVVFLSTDNDLSMSISSTSGRTPFKDTARIYPNPGARPADYIRHLSAAYDTVSSIHTLIVRVVPNSNCNFLFTGSYSFRHLLPPSPSTFTSDITETGTNMATISNFANSGKNVQVTFNCASELLTIPVQALDSSRTIRGSGSWTANGLTINYTASTSTFTYSGTIQGNR